jgi:flavin reductase (DIM6/NTAB) family NADH-FMN oxidoreductase RutF
MSAGAAEGVESRALRDAMGHFATGVTVVTAAAAGGAYGTTANAITSLSLDPPLVLGCLRRASETLAAIRQAGAFAINVLGAGQRGLAERFARPAAPDTWRGVAHRLSGGVPLLDDAVATLECVVHDLVDGGDHVIVVGRVVSVDRRESDADPLLFYRGGFADLAARAPEAPETTDGTLEVALPSALGALRMLALPQGEAGGLTVAVLVGEPRRSTGALLYLHRGCVLGDAFGSQACRGRDRLHGALERMRREGGPGVIVYRRDDGLGFGACCLGERHEPRASAAEQDAVRQAVRLLELRDPVPIGDADAHASGPALGLGLGLAA